MSARGLCNQELGVARKLLLQAVDSPSLYPVAARQLYFCYQCFLLELAELHKLPKGQSVVSAAELMAALKDRLGSEASIAELESVERTEWLQLLRNCTYPEFSLTALSAQKTPARADKNSIKFTEVIDNKDDISAASLQRVEQALAEWIARTRELTQEY